MATTRDTPALPASNKEALAGFLKARRALLVPADFGFPAAGRRRTPGLRREEIAQLCHISTTWYTWIEQGRDVAVSAAALVRLARVLKLSQAERTYLFGLAGKKDPQEKSREETAVPPALRRAVNAITAPAYVLGRYYEPVTWNRAAARHFSGWLTAQAPRLTLLEYMFLEPTAREFVVDWSARARRLVAEFRADVSAFLGETALKEHLSALVERSTEFRRYWTLHDVVEREGGVRAFRHARKGIVRFEQVNLSLAQRPDVKLVMLLPSAARN